MEEQWYADRSQLRTLLQDHPDWSTATLAAELGRSVGWVKKWKRRLRAKAILYSLSQDSAVAASGARLPRSTRTIWQILVRHGRIARPCFGYPQHP